MSETTKTEGDASEIVRTLVMADSGPIETDPEVREVIGQAILTSIICTHQDDDWPGSFCPTCWESTQRIGEALVRALPQLQFESHIADAWDQGYATGTQDEFDWREGNEHENADNPYRATGAASGGVVVDGRAAYFRATSALSELVILANNEGAEVALDKTLGALQSALADLGVAVS